MELLKSFFEASPLTQILLLSVLIALSLREWQRTRRERAERHDTGRLERFRAEQDERQRNADLLRASLDQLAAQRQEVADLTSRIGQFAESNMQLSRSINENTKLEIERIQANERIHQANNQALIENVKAIGDSSDRLRSVDKGLQKVDQNVDNTRNILVDQYGVGVNIVQKKIDTAVGQAGDMLEQQFEAMQKDLNELRETLRDIQEKVSHIPELEQCLVQTTRALEDLANIKARLVSERDTAVGELDNERQQAIALRNALIASDADKLNKETELLRLKEVLMPPAAPPVASQPGTEAPL